VEGEEIRKTLKALIRAYWELREAKRRLEEAVVEDIVRSAESVVLKELLFNFKERKELSKEELEKALRKLMGVPEDEEFYDYLRKILNSTSSS